jgi:hypothetical protein
MGYAVGTLVHLADLLRTTPIKGRRVIDLGSQDVTVFDQTDSENLRRFVAGFGGDPSTLDKKLQGDLPVVIPALEIFSAAGFDYLCCDVDRRPKTIHIDFNTLAFDQTLYGKANSISS